MSEIINSFNIFIDSQQGLSGKGDDVTVQVGSAGLVLEDGQIFRINVEQFNMNRVFYNIHGNNSLFRISSTGAS